MRNSSRVQSRRKKLLEKLSSDTIALQSLAHEAVAAARLLKCKQSVLSPLTLKEEKAWERISKSLSGLVDCAVDTRRTSLEGVYREFLSEDDESEPEPELTEEPERGRKRVHDSTTSRQPGLLR